MHPGLNLCLYQDTDPIAEHFVLSMISNIICGKLRTGCFDAVCDI